MIRQSWRMLLAVVAVALLVGGHGFALYFVTSHVALSATVLTGVVLVALLKHLGLFASLYAMFRRRSR
jgi:hypothetical protein